MLDNRLEVRAATPADQDAVFALAREFATSFVVERTAFDIAYQELLRKSDAAILVAPIGAEVLGYCLVFEHTTFYANGRVAWVEEITVRAGHRRAGLGGRLMQAAEEWARSRGAKLVGLATRRASAFYTALGYEESASYFRKRLDD